MSFVITKDHIDDKEHTDVIIHGPGNAEHTVDAIMRSSDKEYFRMYDDDDELYYEGYYLYSDKEDSEDECTELQPLDCYGTPNAGCTYMKMRDKETGKMVHV